MIGDVTRVISRIRQCVVKAGRESSAAKEFSGPGDLLDSDCLKGETQEEHAWNFIPRRSDDNDIEASRVSNSTRTPCNSSSTGFTSSDVRIGVHASLMKMALEWLRVASTRTTLDVRRYSLARKRISNRGQRRWRHSSLERSRSQR